MKTVLFGLDGATFTVLDHLVDSGVMPNLKSFYESGVRSKLLSTPLPITPQAWTSMATGRFMGKHGVNDFVRIEINDNQVFARYNTSRDIHCETIWKYASRHGLQITALNYIGLSPPEPVNGHTIPGFVPGRHLRRSSYPKDLFNKLQQAENFDISVLGLDLDVEKQVLTQMPEENWLPWIDHHITREQTWFAVMEHLMLNDPSDLTAIVLDGVDKIQHLAYRFLDPTLAPTDPTPWEASVIERCQDYFRHVDQFLGRTKELVGQQGRVFIASDHGFTASTELVYINKFLCDEGLLVWKEQGQADENETVFVDKLQNHLDLIDLSRTKAFALTPSSNGIFIHVSEEEYGAFRAELIEKLYSLKGPDGGQVVTDVKVREEWFAGPYMHHAPDLTLTLRDFGLLSVLNAHQAVVPRKQPWGTHHPDGVLLGHGPGIKQGCEVPRRDIVDVTALLAHSLGLEIPADYDGKFPDSFYESFYLESDPARIGEASVTEAPTETDAVEAELQDEIDEAAVLERLRSLGYVE